MGSKRFGGIVRKAMQDKGMKQYELAQKVGISPSLLCQLLAGKRKPPSSNTVKKLARVLGIKPELLMAEARRAQPRMVPLLRAASPLTDSELQRVIREAERIARRSTKRGRK